MDLDGRTDLDADVSGAATQYPSPEHESSEQLRVAFDHAPTPMVMVSLEPTQLGRLVRANAAFTELLGYQPGDLVGRDPATWTAGPDLAATWERLRGLADESADSGSYEKRYLRKDGSVVHTWVTTAVVRSAQGAPQFAIAHVVDETERRRHEHELERVALTDHLTGLANRSTIEGHLADALARLERAGSGVLGVLMLDLDGFKLVNESRGHTVGDQLLVEVARRLTEVTRSDTTVARLGGDEFLLIERAVGPAEVRSLAERVLEALRAPYPITSGESLQTTASLGIALAWRHTRSPDDLLSEADLALYEAKDRGRDRFAVYDDGLRTHILDRVETEARLRRALRDDGLQVVLQPVVDLRHGTTVGAEALIRLHDPDHGELGPDTFIHVAEASALIVDLDTWVVDEVVRLLGADARKEFPLLPERIAVNVSGRTVEHPTFVARVRDALHREGVAGGRLLIELTESSLLADKPSVRDCLSALDALEVRVGIDDFGTGYSALAYLERFPLSFLKIDISFIRQLGTNLRANAVVAAIIALAHAHGLVVTAEGVENESQAAALRAMACDNGQGWLFGRPASPG